MYIQNNYTQVNRLKQMEISMSESDLVGELTSKMYFYTEARQKTQLIHYGQGREVTV